MNFVLWEILRTSKMKIWMIQWLTACSNHSALSDAATIISMFLLITFCMLYDLQHDFVEFEFHRISIYYFSKNQHRNFNADPIFLQGFPIGPTSQDWDMWPQTNKCPLLLITLDISKKLWRLSGGWHDPVFPKPWRICWILWLQPTTKWRPANVIG